MTATFTLPAAPLPRFLEIYQAARSSGRWFEKQSHALRHASLALITLEGRPAELVRQMRRTANALRQNDSRFGPMQSSMRYVFAAHLLALHLSPERVLGEMERLKPFLRDEKLPRATRSYVAITTLVLLEQALHASGPAHVTRDQVSRLAKVYRAFKEDHPWLTGADDLAPAALLAGGSGAPRAIAARTEAVYQELRAHRYGRGNALQMAAQLLSLHPADPAASVRRFDALYQAFRAQGLWMMECDYDEVAGLAFTQATPQEAVAATLLQRAALREQKLGLGKNESFSLAACLAMLELLSGEGDTQWEAFAMIVRVQAIVQAQAAAIAASSGGAAAAVT